VSLIATASIVASYGTWCQ